MTATMTTAATATATGLADGTSTGTDTTRLFGPRGRHRKPRPRKVLLAASGLTLAAGALSLVRMTPDAGVGGFGAAEANPQAALGVDTDIDTGRDRVTNAAATVGSVPQASPSSTTAMGGISATRTQVTSSAPPWSATAVPLPLAAAPTTIPEAPNTPAPTATASTTPHAPAATTAPQPARTTPPPAPTPTPRPTHPTQPAPGLCVPVIGLCVQQRG
ncbi:hypothetical protein QFZ22_004021 [Streptomyces canus]|uniref:Uncharacterized protein n=1 Tax=Streptomyces canus TaxID=58343 RepID=A0AAW8FFL8_9ACTN|nr:hypothetical protein [Streptomyces canus]MDQ0908036.1 hypothetical protein [Streptomyces canus]